jgi:hypothetical protein
MSSISKQVLSVVLILVGMTGVSGCASKEADIASLKRLLASKQARIDELKLTRADMQRVIDLKTAELERQKELMLAGPHGGMAKAAVDAHGVVTAARHVQEGSGEVMWLPISCQPTVTPEMVRQIQRALKEAYYYHGPLDGVYGSQTRRAVTSYQRTMGLAVGDITFETLQSLGLQIYDQQVIAGAKQAK